LESSDGIIQGVVHLIRRGGKVASEKRAGNRYFDVAAALSEEVFMFTRRGRLFR
jgi:hypothetical protein